MSDLQAQFSVLKQIAGPAVAGAIEKLIESGEDHELNRINPLDFSVQTGLDEEQVISGFLHASRLGLFDLSKQPNDTALETNLSQYELTSELEHRHTIAGHPGVVRLGLWANHGRFLKLADAIAAYNTNSIMPDPASLRRQQTRLGGYLNVEQELSASVGLFARAGLADGSIEAYDFTDIDRTLSVGAQIKGALWGRADDKIGLAGVVNAISKARQTYFADGGLGILVGDGRLPHPGDEQIIESYYDWQLRKGLNLTGDYQFIANPGYNRDRGPAHVFALRLHAGF